MARMTLFMLLLLSSACAQNTVNMNNCKCTCNCYDPSPFPPPPPQPSPRPQSYPTPPPTTLFGEIEAYVSHNHTESKESVSFSIKTDPNNTANFTSVPLKFPNTSAIGLVTGENIQVNLKRTNNHRRRSLHSNFADEFEFEVDSIIKTGKPPTVTKDFVVGGKPVNITSITMLVTDLCGVQNKLTEANLYANYFNDFAPKNYATLENMHSTCSHNKLRFIPQNNIIIGNVAIPCQGVFNKQPYDSLNKCDSAEIYGWMNHALEFAKSKNINISKYKRRVLILPFMPKCPWSGLASVGCTSSCNTWINNANKDVDMPTLFQELGHNIGLMHSNRNNSWQSQEYGDCTDPMGCGGPNPARKLSTITCPNLPQQFKAGWSYPIDQGIFDLNWSFEDGLPLLRDLPAAALTDMNMIRIKISDLPPYAPNPSFKTPQEHAIYISYRVRQPDPGFDSGLSDEFTHKVYIHTYNFTVQSPPRPDPSADPFKPMLIAMLDTKQAQIKALNMRTAKFVKYWFTNKGLNISLLEKSNTTAIISLCSYSLTQETNCEDGLDDDCNGLTDMEDPACWSAMPPTTPYTPSPPIKIRPPPSPPPPIKKRSPPPPPPIKRKRPPTAP